MESNKGKVKKGVEEKLKQEFLEKQMKSEMFRKQDESCNLWPRQNLTPRQTAS